MGLETIGLAMTIGSGIMGVVNGFAQAGVAKQQAAAEQEAAHNQQVAADQNYAFQVNAAQRLNNEQAVSATAAGSDRMAQAQRNLGTLQAVMAERGFSSNTFVGLANDIYNSESVDLSRIGTNFANLTAADRARMDVAGMDRNNAYLDANSRIAAAKMSASVASTSAWLNGFGTTLKVGGGYIGQQIQLEGTQKRYDALLGAIGKGAPVSPYAGSGL